MCVGGGGGGESVSWQVSREVPCGPLETPGVSGVMEGRGGTQEDGGPCRDPDTPPSISPGRGHLWGP